MVFIIFLLARVQALCVFSQNCTSPSKCKTPYPILPTLPFKPDFSSPYACPMFLNQDVCCNNDQNLALGYKYFLIDETFGHAIGGCDICAANLKRLWCYFTCSPDQNQFVTVGSQEYVTDPTSLDQKVLALLVNFTVTADLASDIHQSCAKCPIVTEVSAMQSPLGFLNFQGYNSISFSLLWTTFSFGVGSVALDLEIVQCEAEVTTAYGYPVVPCGCNSCDQACTSDYKSTKSTLDGLNWVLVGICYLVLIVLSLIFMFSKYMWQRNVKNTSKTDNELILNMSSKDYSDITN